MHPSGYLLRRSAAEGKIAKSSSERPVELEQPMPADKSPVPDSTRLATLEAGQTAIVTALGLVLDTLQQQTNLLYELVDAARDEPGPSPVIISLDELTEAVVRMGAGVESLAQKFDELPDAIGAAFAQGAGQGSVPAAPAPP
jgi:hypothetical protein